MAEGQEYKSFAHNQDVLTILNRDMANEMNTSLLYLADSLMVKGDKSFALKEVASKFSKQDMKHVHKLAARIVELEGTPMLMPAQIDSNASIDLQLPKEQWAEPMLKECLKSELQSCIEYRGQIQNIAFTDPATRLLLEEILADKEHQVEEIRNLLGL